MRKIGLAFLINDLKNELYSASEHHPSTVDLLPALMEEVGELSQALLQQKYESGKGVKNEHVYAEAMQVAALAIRIARDGIDGFPYDPTRFRPNVPPRHLKCNS